jgi:hypothetical protein
MTRPPQSAIAAAPTRASMSGGDSAFPGAPSRSQYGATPTRTGGREVVICATLARVALERQGTRPLDSRGDIRQQGIAAATPFS